MSSSSESVLSYISLFCLGGKLYEKEKYLGTGLRISYELARSEGFPALRIGTRIVIPKDKLQEWVDKQTEKI